MYNLLTDLKAVLDKHNASIELVQVDYDEFDLTIEKGEQVLIVDSGSVDSCELETIISNLSGIMENQERGRVREQERLEKKKADIKAENIHVLEEQLETVKRG
jgi:hypothetical protein